MITSANTLAHAGSSAEREAVKLYAFGSNTYPMANQAFLKLVEELVLDTLFAFCLHARRSAEIAKLPDFEVTTSFWEHMVSPEVRVETSFWKCVNLVLHSRDIHCVFYDGGSRRFVETNRSDAILLHISASSDRYPNVHFNLAGLAWDYLAKSNKAVRAVKPKKPH